MEPLTLGGSSEGEKADEPVAARAGDWLWKPWYAKLWWTCILFYWAGKLASYWIAPLDRQYSTALAGVLNVAFFPPLAVMFLGWGFARKWFASTEWDLDEPSDEGMFPPRSVGGLRHHNADALDPKSGMLHWRHFHPDN